jgi:hypothetical protein
MSSTLQNALDAVHPQMLRVQGEVVPQELGKREIGAAIEKALDRASLTKKEAAFEMGYADSGVIGRWITGTETPQFWKLWGLGDRFRQELVIALAELADCEIQTTVQIKKRA